MTAPNGATYRSAELIFEVAEHLEIAANIIRAKG